MVEISTGAEEKTETLLPKRNNDEPLDHLTQTSTWLPPAENWIPGYKGFPYGWEEALDKDGKLYFINHLNKTTTYEDPRKDWTEEPPQPREVELTRHPELGFGFVAGSEKPVIVRFVTEGGPSVDKLQPGDQILKINAEDVKKAPRDHVIQLVRSCKETVHLTVCQPPLDNSARKSAILSAAKKAKLKSNPSRVRFAEGVVVNGSPLFPPSDFSIGDSYIPFMPNVLKVFLENGQTKSFKYDSNTAVQDVLESLQQKLCIKAMEHFSLVVEHVKSLRRNKLTLLDPMESLARIAARPGAHNLRCLFRVTFLPKDAYELVQKDIVAFEYLYMQCCNDVVQERFAPELKYDIALRLAALHIQQHALSNNMTGKLTVKAIEREFGLERFVPVSLIDTMKRKELRKLISHFLKLNQNMSGPGQKNLTSLQAKLHYLHIIGELPSYGAKCFSTNLRDSNMETVILISPKFGISQIAGIRNSTPVTLADVEQMAQVTVTKEDELSRQVHINFTSTDENELVLSLEDRDADELVLVLQGYYRLLTGKELIVEQDRDPWTEDVAPPYHSQHKVQADKWSYGLKDKIHEHLVNFSIPPPYHPIPDGCYVKSNGHVPSAIKKTEALGNTNNVGTTYGVDNNMNNMHGLLNMNGTTKDCNGYGLDDNKKTVANKEVLDLNSSSHKLGFDIQSVVSMEILECDVNCIEAKNEEVIRRVAEMQELVENSEQYLTEQSREESDSEGSHLSSSHDSDAPGQLKHSDSLLLLTQGQKLLTEAVNDVVKRIEMEDNEPSESDTDSMSTPTNSPSHRPVAREQAAHRTSTILKSSDSSFGLHSPDNLLPAGFRANDHDIQELLKKLQEDNSLPYNFAEGTLYLDPDIIDLTMIPPPVTPDEDGLHGLPNQLSMPPTPFADHSSLEVELQSMEQVANERNMLTNPGGWVAAGVLTPDEILDHNAMLGDLLSLDSSMAVNDENVSEAENALAGLDLNLDFESFLATVTVPPPDEQNAAAVELTPEEIKSYIIPPPPGENNIPFYQGTLSRNGSRKECIGRHPGDYMRQDLNERKAENGRAKYSPVLNRDQNRLDLSKSPNERSKSSNGFSCCGRSRGESPYTHTPVNPTANYTWNTWNGSIEKAPKPESRNGPSNEASRNRLNHGNVSHNGLGYDTKSVKELAYTFQCQSPALPAKLDQKLPSTKPPLPPVSSQDILKKSCQRSPLPVPKFNGGHLRTDISPHIHSLNATLPRQNDRLSKGSNSTLVRNGSGPRNGHIIRGKLDARDEYRELYAKTDEAMEDLLQRLEVQSKLCGEAQNAGGGIHMNEDKFQESKELLTVEVRHLVTGSKLFVKSITESSSDLPDHLSGCLVLLERLTELTEDISSYTSTPLQTQNLVHKVWDVAMVFRETVASAARPEPSMDHLMEKAESLARVLATLIRSLRVFAP